MDKLAPVDKKLVDVHQKGRLVEHPRILMLEIQAYEKFPLIMSLKVMPDLIAKYVKLSCIAWKRSFEGPWINKSTANPT